MTQAAPPEPRPGSLALPRPNPGPEPWDDAGASTLWMIVGLAAAATLAWLARRSLGRRRPPPAPVPLADDASPGEHLLALCDRLRAELAAKLGPTLRARTTEELATDPRVAELLGDHLPRLAEILGEGDRLKFARRPIADLGDRLPEWSAWAASRGPR